ncbi:hypothetical protein [Myxosarcina sp. GI1]|uniref:hypothetical protein n=1 Tax=Myxosarcina sp. GI1 TaxID=1541065 RepID=UPI00068C579F|nr:hypothetical protein [Myxosarcina sp. GI1]
MTELNTELALEQTTSLIRSYAFDLGKSSIEGFLQKWLDRYHASWIRLATIEALYLGRYKAVSIEQILSVWLRIGTPNTHFTHEFERLICRKLPTYLIDITDISTEAITDSSTNNKRDNNSSKFFNRAIEKENIELKNGVVKKPLVQEQSSEETIAAKKSSTIKPEVSSQQLQSSDRPSDTGKATRPQHTPLESSSESSVNNGIQSNSASNLVPAMNIPFQADWNGFAAEQTPIHQFVPMPDVSDFYNKLKAFGREKLEEQ